VGVVEDDAAVAGWLQLFQNPTVTECLPLLDVGAAIVDARSSRASQPALGFNVNIAISVIAAIGLVFAVTSGIPPVLQVWGVWAVLAAFMQVLERASVPA
jgi:hypothetical protein